MESKTLKALQFFYDRGPTPFIKLSNYLNEFSAEYRYLLATGMNDSNKVYFDSREDAVDAGYRPCRVCRP